MRDNPPIFYLWLYRKIKKKARGVLVPYAYILETLKRSIPWTPRSLFYPIIKDLEKYKLLKKIDRRKYEITGGNADSSLNRYNCPL